MAVPKRRTSKAKRDKRRSHDSLAAPTRTNCATCGASKMPHRVCPNCGNYRGRVVVEGEEE